MPQWEGIEDSSALAAPVWFQRTCVAVEGSKVEAVGSSGSESSPKTRVSPTKAAATDTKGRKDSWKPLRKSDCQRLNETLSQEDTPITPETTVVVDSGRATALPLKGILRYNFVRGPLAERSMDYATWFVVQDEKTHAADATASLLPIFHKQDSLKIEALYQQAVQAASSLGKGVASVLDANHVITLHDESKVRVVKLSSDGGRLALKQIPKSSNWQLFSHATYLLQRGYGEYHIPGEETELQLGPVRHLVFVVHGIGEALFSRDDLTQFPGLVETIQQTRLDLQEKQMAHYQAAVAKQANPDLLPRPPPARIELVPIEWFDELHDSSSSLMKSLRAATLRTIPSLRAIANDVVFDVLMYMTPAFCHAVLECVTRQIHDMYDKFLQIHPDFVASGGKCSLVGHSLGSVICWDLLSVLKESASPPGAVGGVSVESEKETMGYHAYAGHSEPLSNTAKTQHGTWGPFVVQNLTRTLPFVPEATVFLGSPLGIFLTLRGAHPVFDAMRKKSSASQEGAEESTPLEASPFTLPTTSLYNIFHPSDPVAYRIEPLLLSPDLDPDNDLPPPLYLTAPGKQVRLDLKAKQLGDEIRKSLMDTKKSSNWGSLLSSAVTALSTDVPASGSVPKSSGGGQPNKALVFALGGKSPRVDFSLQPGVIQNEYFR